MEPGCPAKRRVLDALSDEEERHAILAKVHMALAGCWRHQELEKVEGRKDEARAVRDEIDQLQEELREALVAADEEVLADTDSMKSAVLLPIVQKDPVVMLRLLQTMGGEALFDHASPELLADRGTMLKAVGLHGKVLRSASQALQDDKEVVLKAIESDPWSLAYASDALKADREVVLAAIAKQDPADTTQRGDSVLTLATPKLKDDKELVLAAIAQKATALKCASEPLKCDRSVVLAALREQRKRGRHHFHQNVFSHASPALRDDRALVLEAVKAGGAAVSLASSELRHDEDFILAAMRVAPVHGRQHCYWEASDAVCRNRSISEFKFACDSVLALAGEDAPVLTISPGPAESQSSSCSSPSFCEVTLLSGASFSCSLLRPPNLDFDNEPEAPRQPVSKQRRLTDLLSGSFSPQTEPTYVTVGELARQALEEAKEHMQVAAPPERVFLVFSKTSSGSSEPISTTATPWDWNRPVIDFL